MTDPDDLVCAARVFDERTPGDSAEIVKLRSDTRVTVRDLHAAQAAELRGLRDVPDELQAEAPRWVYYPWRASLVRVLGPRGYRRLRLDRNRNKITPDEQDFYAGLRIGVLGASVGHLVALGLALEGLFGTLRIADYDTVELSNLNRLPGSVLDYGLAKTTVIARRIAELDPYLTVLVDHDGVDRAGAAAFVAEVDLLIEVCDSLDVKLAVREQAARAGVPVLMVTSDRGTVDVERFDREPGREPFHGLVRGFRSDMLAGLPATEKVPYVMSIVGADGISARMAASMLEIGHTLTAWPHLAGDAMQAAAAAVMAVRRLAPGARLDSGRLHVDIASALDDIAEPVGAVELPPFAEFGEYRNLAEPDSDLAAIVAAAQLAPSGGNAQPWRITPHDRHIDLELDETRTTAMDVGFRASYVAMGAALLNMRVAAAARHLLGPTDPLAHGGTRLRLGTGTDPLLVELSKPMLARVTNRQLSEPGRRLPDAELRALAAAADAERAGLRLITDPDAIAETAAILADTDRIRFLLPRLHGEMMAELVDPRRGPVERGLDIRTLEMGSAAGMLDIARRADVLAALAERDAAALDAGADGGYGTALGARIGALAGSSSALAAVVVRGAEAADYLRGGAAMQRVWITATAAGIAAQPLVPLFLFTRDDAELVALAGRYSDRLKVHRQRLRELFAMAGEDSFAIVLRLGYGPAPTAISLRSADVVAHNARDRPKRGKQ